MEKAILTKPEEPLEVVKDAVPSVPAKGLLIKMLYSGICQSDLKLQTGAVDIGDGKKMNYLQCIGEEGFHGIVAGHEICGQVMEVGSEVGAECPHKVGDTVIVFPWTGCRNCEYCDADLSQSCPYNKVSTADIGRGYDGRKHGGFQTHFPLQEWKFAIKLPESIPPHVGCMLPCSTITTFTGLTKAKPALDFAVKARGQARLLIIGMGGLGSWALILAKTIYGDKVRVYCADLTEDKMAAAKEMKGDDTILLKREDTVDDMVAKFTADGKLDACLDIVGLPKTIEACFWSLQNEGIIVPLGIGGGKMGVATPTLIGRSISIMGSRTGSIGLLRELIALLAEKGLYATPPMEYVGLGDVNDVFARMKTGKVNGRAILKFV